MEPLDIKPTTQEQIPEVLRALRQQLEDAQGEVKWIQDHIESIQNICKHPDTVNRNIMGRWPETVCTICGKSI